MKFYQWICGAFLLGAIASCSNDDISGPDTPKEGEAASGYLALKINLPQEGASRADDLNDDNVIFDDGEGWEYGVNDAKLLLFTAADKDGDPKFYKSYTLNRPFSSSDPANDQITSSSVEAVAVNFTDKTEHLWALVMLNVPAGVNDPEEGETFGDYRKNVIDEAVKFMKTESEKKYIFMTNAPLSAKRGGYVDPTSNPTINTLVYLGIVEDKVKPSLQEARENVAGCIYVERALAKVTATFSNPVVQIKSGKTDEGGNPIYLGIKVNTNASRFYLDHMNKKSYVIRNVIDWPAQNTLKEEAFKWNMTSPALVTDDGDDDNDNDAYYRMIGSIKMPGYAANPVLHNTEQSKYRTYWCVDPNYNTELGADYTTSVDADYLPLDGKSAFYPKENTFTVENQNYGNSTLAVFKVTFVKDNNSSVDLFIINKDDNVVYTDVNEATSNMYQYILSQDKIKEALKGSVKSGVTVTDAIDFTPFLGLEFARSESTGIYSVTDIFLNDGAEGFDTYYDGNSYKTFDATIKDVEEDYITRVNALYEITQYKGGVSYYAIPIQHFGEVSTPWTASADKDQSVTDQAYPATNTYKYDSQSFLGRYGVVRNNWYEIDVTSFQGLGYPVKPDFKDVLDLSDDNNPVKKYIGVETHILSWAKRTQSVHF